MRPQNGTRSARRKTAPAKRATAKRNARSRLRPATPVHISEKGCNGTGGVLVGDGVVCIARSVAEKRKKVPQQLTSGMRVSTVKPSELYERRCLVERRGNERAACSVQRAACSSLSGAWRVGNCRASTAPLPRALPRPLPRSNGSTRPHTPLIALCRSLTAFLSLLGFGPRVLPRAIAKDNGASHRPGTHHSSQAHSISGCVRQVLRTDHLRGLTLRGNGHQVLPSQCRHGSPVSWGSSSPQRRHGAAARPGR